MKYNITGLVLAAGAASRMGLQKAMIDIDGKPLIRRHLDTLGSVCNNLIVVSGFRAKRLRPWISDATEIHNINWSENEMRQSILKGILTLEDHATVLVTPVDTVPLSKSGLERLIQSPTPAVCVHKKQFGHPLAAQVSWLKDVLQNGDLELLFIIC